MYSLSMVLMGFLMPVIALQAFAGDNEAAVCNPNSPIVVEQGVVKLFSFTGGDADEVDGKTMEAITSFIGEPILRIHNITDQQITVTVGMYGDDGFLINHALQMPEDNAPSYSLDIAPGSNVVVPLVYQPAMPLQGAEQEGPNGEQIVAGNGVARVSVEQYAGYVSETYLVGLSVVLPELESLDPGMPESDEPIEGDEGTETPAS